MVGLITQCLNFVSLLWRPAKSAGLASAESVGCRRLFTQEELFTFKQAYKETVGTKPGLSTAQGFQELLGLTELDAFLTERLFALTRGAADCATFEDCLLSIARCRVRGSEALRVCYDVLRGHSPELLPKDLAHGVAACYKWDTGNEAPATFLTAVAGSAGCGAQAGSAKQHISLAEFSRWVKSVPRVITTVLSLLGDAPHGRPFANRTVPRLLPPIPEDCLLTSAWCWLISSWLPAEQAEEWQLLYSSKKGKSFSILMGSILGRGPTLLLVRDKQGYLFGGYAASPWEKTGHFYGTSQNFIFSLQPDFALHRASGANSNFQWCGHNFVQLPNGIGWGGQTGHYALFLDSTCDAGMSRGSSATFASACIASAEAFDVDMLEVWVLLQSKDDSAPAALGHGSVLDRAADRSFLDIAGRGSKASVGIREARPEDDL